MSNRTLSPVRAKLDFETRSDLDVRKVGAARYAEHPTTEILCMAWKIGKGRSVPKGMWLPGQPFPQELIDFAEKGGTFEAHGAMFECAIWLNGLHKRMGIVMPKRWYDTMARCAQRALPLGLDEVGTVLNLDTKKDKKGKYLLQKLTKPKKPTKTEKRKWVEQHGDEPMPLLWHDGNELVPDTWTMDDGSPDGRTLNRALHDYCDQDLESEEDLGEAIGDMDENEYRLWVLDQTINWRGVQVDVDAAESALAIVAEIEEKLCRELSTITGGDVTTGSQVARIKDWVLKQGVALPTNAKGEISLAKDAVDQAIGEGDEDYEEDEEFDDDNDDGNDRAVVGDNGGPPLDDSNPAWPKVRRVLQIRQQLSRASTKKLKKILECMCSDGRLRGMLQYHGAMSGRWAGRLSQPHNFPRGNPKIIKKGNENLIAAIKCRNADLLTLFYGDPMDAIASSLRGMFIAGKGKILRVADFSAIEARVTMWLAGEKEALEAFAKSDRKEGPDIYCVMAMKLYNRPINKDENPEERQLGKITILGCLGAETEVQTRAGWKCITDVKKDDLVWDGFEFVSHDGVIDRGEKETVLLGDVKVTSDHLIMTPYGWHAAGEITDESGGTTRTYDILNCGPRSCFVARCPGQKPIIVHNCGYQMGAPKLQFQAKKDYKVDLTDEQAQFLVDGYRSSFPKVKDLWYGLQEAAISAVLYPGRAFSYRGITYLLEEDRIGEFLTCELPNGRKLQYLCPEIHDVMVTYPDGTRKMRQQLGYWGRDNKKGARWSYITTYGGMLCLGADTEVLTDYGWKRITDILIDDTVWDGVEWVSHNGLIYKGERDTISLDGLRLTPSHEVLTDEGWVPAADCDVERAHAVGEALRGPHFRKAENSNVHRTESSSRIIVVESLRMRTAKSGDPSRSLRRRRYLVWLRSAREAGARRFSRWRNQRYAPDVESSSLSRVAFNDGSLSFANTSSMGKLRRPWHSSLRALANFRELLGRYGRYVRTWALDRTQKQRRSLFSNELLLGVAICSGSQSTHNKVAGYACWPYDAHKSCSALQSEKEHAVLATQERLDRRESVYDLLNAGPRHRFMVRTDHGVIIVHNCENIVQAISRDIMAESMIRVEVAGYPIVLTVHDEIVAEPNEGFGSQEEFDELMKECPIWIPGCPINVEGWSGHRYKKA